MRVSPFFKQRSCPELLPRVTLHTLLPKPTAGKISLIAASRQADATELALQISANKPMIGSVLFASNQMIDLPTIRRKYPWLEDTKSRFNLYVSSRVELENELEDVFQLVTTLPEIKLVILDSYRYSDQHNLQQLLQKHNNPAVLIATEYQIQSPMGTKLIYAPPLIENKIMLDHLKAPNDFQARIGKIEYLLNKTERGFELDE